MAVPNSLGSHFILNTLATRCMIDISIPKKCTQVPSLALCPAFGEVTSRSPLGREVPKPSGGALGDLQESPRRARHQEFGKGKFAQYPKLPLFSG